jgi:hypothetical protein
MSCAESCAEQKELMTPHELLLIIKEEIAKNEDRLPKDRVWSYSLATPYVKTFVGTHSERAFLLAFQVAVDADSCNPFTAAHKSIADYYARHPVQWKGTTIDSIVKYCRRHVGTYAMEVFMMLHDPRDNTCAKKVHAFLDADNASNPFPLDWNVNEV